MIRTYRKVKMVWGFGMRFIYLFLNSAWGGEAKNLSGRGKRVLELDELDLNPSFLVK